jgi:hypothetical protein
VLLAKAKANPEMPVLNFELQKRLRTANAVRGPQTFDFSLITGKSPVMQQVF